MEFSLDQKCRGTRILFGEEVQQRRLLLNKLIALAESYGFAEIVLPSIEPTSTYIDKAGPEILTQMYTFKDKGDRDCCLRPEGTATIQLLANKHWKTQKDVRLWYFEKCWRYERPQVGRYREFFQFGVEWVHPTKPAKPVLLELASQMVELRTSDFTVNAAVKRGLSYYTEDGFEISVPSLGAQQQVCGGGAYAEGVGFALGFDRLMLCDAGG